MCQSSCPFKREKELYIYSFMPIERPCLVIPNSISPYKALNWMKLLQ